MMQRLRELLEDVPQKVWLGGILVLLAVVAFFMIWTERGEVNSSLSQQEQILQTQRTAVQDTFSELAFYSVGLLENRPSFEVHLYLKKPLISSGDMQYALQSYVALLKNQYNFEKDDIYIGGVKLLIYDRISNYEENTNPRATAIYQLLQVSEDAVEKNVGVPYNELRWEQTIGQKKAPNYDEYTLNSDFQALEVSQVSPFTEQEYAFYRKLLLYETLAGSNGLSTYMFWELGILPSKSDYLVLQQLQEFLAEGRKYKENANLYVGKERELSEIYAIKNPRLVAYIHTQEVFDTKLEAKKALVKFDREVYLPVFIEEAQEIVRNAEGAEKEESLRELQELQTVGE